VPVVRGRDFTKQDTDASPQVAIVNQTFVKRFFPGKEPIGQHFGIDRTQYSGSFEIVGVFADFKMNNPRDPARPVFLRPLAQTFTGYKEPDMVSTETQSEFMQAMIIGFNTPQQDADALIRHTLAGIDPNLTVTDLRTFGDQVAGNFNQDRLIARLTSLFGILALILATVGLYGVMSYFVARRTSEIGIRMALGATRSSVVGMVMRGALWQILIGLALGIPAALYAGYLMKVLLYEVAGYDPVALIGAPLLLVICAAAAGFIPARRAASVEPMQALRTE
jgi:predicted permease